jgi:hypothetical protein
MANLQSTSSTTGAFKSAIRLVLGRGTLRDWLALCKSLIVGMLLYPFSLPFFPFPPPLFILFLFFFDNV